MTDAPAADPRKRWMIHYLIYLALFAATTIQARLTNQRYQKILSEYKDLKAHYDKIEAQYPLLKAQYDAQCSPLKTQYDRLEIEYAHVAEQNRRLAAAPDARAK